MADQRINAIGELYFYTVLRWGGHSDEAIRALWNKRVSPDGFRRALRYFHDACVAMGINPESLRRYDDVRRALYGVMDHMWRIDKRSAKVIGEMKSAVSTTFGYCFPDKPLLSHDRATKHLLVSYNRNRPLRKKQLELTFSWKQLLTGLKTLPLPAALSTRALAGKTACLVRGATGTRTSEIAQMDREATAPSVDGKTWSFWVRIKNHPQLEMVTVHKNDDPRIDPIAHLLELQARAGSSPGAQGSSSFWLRPDGTLMSPAVIRAETAKTMKAAGIQDNHSYHIKHATVTHLIDSGIREAEARSFLRHSQKSRVMEDRYVDYHNFEKCVQALKQ